MALVSLSAEDGFKDTLIGSILAIASVVSSTAELSPIYLIGKALLYKLKISGCAPLLISLNIGDSMTRGVTSNYASMLAYGA